MRLDSWVSTLLCLEEERQEKLLISSYFWEMRCCCFAMSCLMTLIIGRDAMKFEKQKRSQRLITIDRQRLVITP